MFTVCKLLRRYGFLTPLALVGALACSQVATPAAQTPVGPSPAAPQAPAATLSSPKAPTESSVRSVLWKVQGSEATLHLLGSIHVASKDMYPLPLAVEQSFEASDTLILELDLSEERKAAAAALLLEAALLPKGDNLWMHIDEELKRALRPKLKELDIPEPAVAPFRPWFVALMVSIKELEQSGFQAELGIDQHFQDRAVGNKEILALESVEEQVKLLSDLGAQAEAEELKQTLELDLSEQLATLTNEWRQGKAEALESQLSEMKSMYPAAYSELFTRRNERMLQKLLELVGAPAASRPSNAAKSYFVVVGAGHLVGPDGLLSGLKQSGFTVEQQ